jgi:hypothetical protein
MLDCLTYVRKLKDLGISIIDGLVVKFKAGIEERVSSV